MKLTSLTSLGRVPGQNICRSGKLFAEVGDLEKLASSLTPGYKPELGIPVVYELDSEGVKLAVEELESEHKEWQNYQTVLNIRDVESGSVVKVAPSHLLRAFEAIHCDGKGNIRPPKFGLTMANRRSYAIVAANGARLVLGKPMITEFPAEVKQFTSELERGIACISGNALTDIGRLKLNGADIVSAAKKLYLLGAKEADLFRALGQRGTAQKAWAIVELDTKFPVIGIVQSILDKPATWGALDKEKMRLLSKGSEKNGVPIGSAEEVAAYFENPKADPKNDPKILAKPQMDNLIARFPVKLVVAVLFAVRHNQAMNLEKFIPAAAEINALTDKLGLTK